MDNCYVSKPDIEKQATIVTQPSADSAAEGVFGMTVKAYAISWVLPSLLFSKIDL